MAPQPLWPPVFSHFQSKKKCLLTFTQNLPHFSLCPMLLAPPLGATKKTLRAWLFTSSSCTHWKALPLRFLQTEKSQLLQPFHVCRMFIHYLCVATQWAFYNNSIPLLNEETWLQEWICQQWWEGSLPGPAGHVLPNGVRGGGKWPLLQLNVKAPAVPRELASTKISNTKWEW